MTRYKKELSKHGFLMENDYPWMPYDCSGGMTLDAIEVEIKDCHFHYTTHYTSVSITAILDKNYNIVDQIVL